MLKLYDAFIVVFIQYSCFYILFKKERGFWVLDYNLSYYYGANIRFNLQHNKIVRYLLKKQSSYSWSVNIDMLWIVKKV
jgi:hypothetical protein